MVPGRDILVRRLSVLPGLACPSDLPRLLEGRDVRTTTKNSIERSSNFPVKPLKEAVSNPRDSASKAPRPDLSAPCATRWRLDTTRHDTQRHTTTIRHDDDTTTRRRRQRDERLAAWVERLPSPPNGGAVSSPRGRPTPPGRRGARSFGSSSRTPTTMSTRRSWRRC